MFALLISLKFVEAINFLSKVPRLEEISGVWPDTNWSNLRGGPGLSCQECHFDIGFDHINQILKWKLSIWKYF